MKKKVLAALLAVGMVLSCVGCGTNEQGGAGDSNHASAPKAENQLSENLVEKYHLQYRENTEVWLGTDADGKCHYLNYMTSDDFAWAEDWRFSTYGSVRDETESVLNNVFINSNKVNRIIGNETAFPNMSYIIKDRDRYICEASACLSTDGDITFEIDEEDTYTNNNSIEVTIESGLMKFMNASGNEEVERYYSMINFNYQGVTKYDELESFSILLIDLTEGQEKKDTVDELAKVTADSVCIFIE